MCWKMARPVVEEFGRGEPVKNGRAIFEAEFRLARRSDDLLGGILQAVSTKGRMNSTPADTIQALRPLARRRPRISIIG